MTICIPLIQLGIWSTVRLSRNNDMVVPSNIILDIGHAIYKLTSGVLMLCVYEDMPLPPFWYAAFRPFRRYLVRRPLVRDTPTEVQMVPVRRILCSASKKALKSVVQCYKLDRIHLTINIFLARLLAHVYLISEKPFTQS